MVNNELLNAKLENAIQVTEAFIIFLKKVNLNGWAERYSKILIALRDGNSTDAISLQKSFSFTGPGSLSDIILEDEMQKHFCKLHGAQSRSIGNIRLLLNYGANRPLIVIDDL